MQLTPLRNIVVLKLLPPSSNRKLLVIRETGAVREFLVEQVGPEVRDVTVGSRVLVNSLVCSQVSGWYLCSEPHVLGTVE